MGGNSKLILLGALLAVGTSIVGATQELLSEGSVLAQPATKKITWTEVAKWPDFTTGIWVRENSMPTGDRALPPVIDAGGHPLNAVAAGIPLKPNLVAKANEAAQKQATGGGSCEPAGVVLDSGERFYFAKDAIVIGGWADWYNAWRRVYMNRTGHGDPEPSYFGDSVGRWEGDTLIIDTVAIRAEAQLARGLPLDSTATHVVERFHLTAPDTMELKKTVENPELLSKPWTTTTILHRKQSEEFTEAYCYRDPAAN